MGRPTRRLNYHLATRQLINAKYRAIRISLRKALTDNDQFVFNFLQTPFPPVSFSAKNDDNNDNGDGDNVNTNIGPGRSSLLGVHLVSRSILYCNKYFDSVYP